VNNESVKDPGQLIGLKGAGDLASAADIVLWLRRSKEYGKARHLDVDIRKNRPFGITGKIELIFSEHYTKIEGR